MCLFTCATSGAISMEIVTDLSTATFMLAYFSDDIRDPEPFTPSHLLHGRRLTSLPHESVSVEDIQDPFYSDKTCLSKAVKVQSLLLSHFNTDGSESI